MDKAVVLAAGRGSRMRRDDQAAVLTPNQTEVARTGLKAMIPVGRPLIDYVLCGLADAGFRRVCLVTAPDHNVLREHCRGYTGGRLEIEFAIQQAARGTADSLLSAQGFVGTDPFLLVNADNLYPVSALAELRQQTGAAVAAFTAEALSRGTIAPHRLRNFAVLSVGHDGMLEQVIEKPTEEQFFRGGNMPLIGMNCWRFTPAIMEACRAIPLSPRGEYELTDAARYAIERFGERFSVLVVDEPVLDLSTQADVAEITRRLSGIEVNL